MPLRLLRALGRPPPRRLLLLLLAVHTAIGAWIVRGAEAHPALQWMAFYRFADFQGFGDAWQFFAELRTGIPPALAALEVTEYLLTGDAWLTDVVLYRVGLILAFALPVVAFRRSTLQTLGAFGVSLLFLASARIVGSPNAQLYDPLTPLFLMGGLLALDAARRRPRAAVVLAACAGFSLSMAELSRPFVLVLLLPLVAWGLLALRGLPPRCRVAFLLPMLLLSGGWHAKLWLVNDGQVLWSNHGGFNLHRAWGDRVEGWPDYVGTPAWVIERPPRPDRAFRGSGRWFLFRWNTRSHAERSRELTRAFLAHVVREPLDSAVHAAQRMGVLLLPKLRVGKGAYLGSLRTPYRWGVRLTALMLLAALCALVFRLARHRRLEQLASLEAAWIPTAWSLIFFLAVGERGEEARFVISVLPFLAALAWPVAPATPGRTAAAGCDREPEPSPSDPERLRPPG